jgi:hypothetical protein
MNDTPFYKAIIAFENGVVTDCGAVQYLGAIWLVPKWLPEPDGKHAKPERMIRLDQFRHQVFEPPATGPDPWTGANFGLNDPLPRTLFDGVLTPQLKRQYVVLDRPDALFHFLSLH